MSIANSPIEPPHTKAARLLALDPKSRGSRPTNFHVLSIPTKATRKHRPRSQRRPRPSRPGYSSSHYGHSRGAVEVPGDDSAETGSRSEPARLPTKNDRATFERSTSKSRIESSTNMAIQPRVAYRVASGRGRTWHRRSHSRQQARRVRPGRRCDAAAAEPTR